MVDLLQQYGLELGLFFVVGLLAEIHCLGMCGPLLTAYVGPNTEQSSRGISWADLTRQFSYHGFRAVAYGLVGAAFGLLGLLIAPVGSPGETFRLLRGTLGVTIGFLIGLYGLTYLVQARSPVRLDRIFGRLGGSLFKYAQVVLGANRKTTGSPTPLRGVLHSLLPCPILYPAYLYVFARGSPTFGFLSMALLGLGTLPLLLAYGLFLERKAGDFPRRVHQVLGAALLFMAYVTVSMGLRNLGLDVPTAGLPFYQPFHP